MRDDVRVPKIAITIDVEHPDRPTSDPIGNARRILDGLREKQVLATFFIQGKWAESNPELTRQIVQEGHHVGSHSDSHCVYPALTAQGMLADLTEARRKLGELVGETRPWFRLPGGRGADDPAIHAIIRQAGFEHYDWNIHDGDWEPGCTPDQLLAGAVATASTLGTQPAVLLLHSWPDPTPVALPMIIDRFRGDGWEFVTLPQLLSN